MASPLALKRLVSSSNLLLSSYLRSVRPVGPSLQQSATRLFNTNAGLRDSDDDGRRSSPVVLCRVGDFHDHPFSEAGLNGIRTTGLRRGWDANETEAAIYFRLDMPGLGKEDIKISVEQDTVIITGEQGEKVPDGEERRRKFTGRIFDVHEKLYKTAEIKAEMKNGVLKLVVPKLKQAERSDVFHVNID